MIKWSNDQVFWDKWLLGFFYSAFCFGRAIVFLCFFGQCPEDIHEPCVAYLEQKSAMLCTLLGCKKDRVTNPQSLLWQGQLPLEGFGKVQSDRCWRCREQAPRILKIVNLQQHLSFADDPTECFPYGAEWCPALRLHICILVLFLKARDKSAHLGSRGTRLANRSLEAVRFTLEHHVAWIGTTHGSKKLRDDPVINNRVPTENLRWLSQDFSWNFYVSVTTDRQW